MSKEKKIEIVFDMESILERINNTLEVADFTVDPLQEQLIQRYLCSDMAFRQAMNYDYTEHFFRYLIHKSSKNEPVSIAIMGIQRGGKSYAAITIHAIMMILRGKKPNSRWILPDKNEYLKMLKLPPDEVRATTFSIDEDKTAVFGTGSVARKMKLLDVQNIIAVNAISTIWIRPDEFSWSDSQYGLRVFGRFEAKYKDWDEWEEKSKEFFKKYLKFGGEMDKKEFEKAQRNCQIKVDYDIYKNGKLSFQDFFLVEGQRRDYSKMQLTRFMLYNLQESAKTGLPLGMVYLPPFTELPELFEDVEKFEKEYMTRKMTWVQQEQESSRDVLYKEKMKLAIQFSRDPSFLEKKSIRDKILYLGVMLGSEFTKADNEEVARLAVQIANGSWSELKLRKFVGETEYEEFMKKLEKGEIND